MTPRAYRFGGVPFHAHARRSLAAPAANAAATASAARRGYTRATMADTFQIQLERLDGYRFQADFGAPVPPLVTDEGPPLGKGAGPSPSKLLATALANCLSASLVFCLAKSRVEVGKLRVNATGTYVRNAQNRLRIGRFDVLLRPELPGSDPAKVQKCLELFEDFCVVTASVRAGLPVGVRVEDQSGRPLYERAG
jgi:uncharacterized OsmC-like protein